MSAHPETLPCTKCPGVDRVLQPFYEGSQTLAYYCPCCKSRLRPAEMIQEDAERRAAERGVTVEAMMEETRALIDPEPPGEIEMERIRAWAAEQARNWTPVCPHDTNPWVSGEESA